MTVTSIIASQAAVTYNTWMKMTDKDDEQSKYWRCGSGGMITALLLPINHFNLKNCGVTFTSPSMTLIDTKCFLHPVGGGVWIQLSLGHLLSSLPSACSERSKNGCSKNKKDPSI